MSAKEGQFATKEGRGRGTNPTAGDQNPLKHVPLGDSPSIPNPATENRTVDSTLQPAGRYEVWSGESVPVGAKPVVGHPRLADESVFHEEGPESNRGITPESRGITINEQSGPVKWADRRRKQ